MNNATPYHPLFRITTFSEQVCAWRLAWRTLWLKKEWGPKLNLKYPTLTGSADMPFVVFKIVKADGSSVNPAMELSDGRTLAGEKILTKDSIAQQTKTLKRDATLGQNENNEIKLYPNPNNGNFMLVLPSSYGLGNIQVTDITGKVVYSSILKEKRSELHLNLEKGMYNLHFSNSNTVRTLQFIVK